jgi:hypothetical protein
MQQRLDFFPGKDLMQNYRNVFGAHDGPKVLNHMLYELGLFEDTSMNPEDSALKNYASRLLRILGGGEVRQAAVELLIKQLNLQPLPKEKVDE